MANAYNYSNIATPTTLSGNINNSVTAATVGSTTGWPGTTPYIVAFDFATANEELVKVTNNAAGTLTIQRGFGGTSAVSHSTGAAVRHVWNAQDGTDFRTHEAATAGAHGITGSFVGTTDSQTLTNKTLTAPSITNGAYSGGGSLAGTFTGTPTLSGALTLSGTPVISAGASMSGTFSGAHTYSGTVTMTGSVTALSVTGELALSNLLRGTRGLATDSQYESRVTADANARWFVRADGTTRWGPGTAGFDTDLYRSAASILGTTSTFRVEPTNTAFDGLAANLPTATAGDLLNLRVNNAIQAAMFNDGQYRIYGGNTPTSYVPTWANIGTATFNTNTGYYWRVGKMVFVVVYATINVAGSGNNTTTPTTFTLPTNPDRSTRQTIPFHGETIKVNGGLGATTIRNGMVVTFTGGSGAVIDRIRVTDSDGDGDNNIYGGDLTAGGILSVTGWYREA